MNNPQYFGNLDQCTWLPMEQMRNSTILVTGGTGLVGFNLLRTLSQKKIILNLRILALVRNIERAKSIFADFLDSVELIEGNVLQKVDIEYPIHYIIHGASITSSKAFVDKPVETILTSIHGVCNMLELCREKHVRSMVYLSSMEAYGSVEKDVLLLEDDVRYLNPLKIRSCYPESKRMCENLCVSYAKEYGVNVKIARLAQTFGPGMQPNDNRAIVQFVRSAMANKDIEIKASGESARMYLYTFDAVTALLTILLNGSNGKAYNVANQNSYCSIRQLAQMICDLFSPQSHVLVNTGTAEEKAIYPPDSYLRLDTSALESLGWEPCVSLQDSLRYLSVAIEELDRNRINMIILEDSSHATIEKV